MSEESGEDRILDHDYDGIREYDNPMPRWWLALFWISIAFSGVYFVYYHLGPGLLAVDAYNKDMIAYYDLQAQQFLALGEIGEGTLLELTADAALMAGGAQIYLAKCAQCHGNAGEGTIGPNLTDDYWLHGAKLTDIYETVKEGVPAKGMLSWKNQLGPAELLAVSAYVGTLRGATPPSPKAPQGTLEPYDPQAAVAAESAPAEPPAADAPLAPPAGADPRAG